MRREVVLPLFVLCFFAADLVRTAHSIWLNLPASGTKCVSEEIQTNVVVLADFVVVADHTHAPTISVKSPSGDISIREQSSENITHGQFAFTTSEGGNYLACFWLTDHKHEAGTEVSVNLDWRTGIAAKDWESVAKKEKIEGVELELKKLEGAVEAIHENLLYLRDREAIMRTVSERTNARVAWYSIMSLGVCIIASTLQIWYLKRFFQKKKLI